MSTASKFSLSVFAPALIAFLLPALFLLPLGVLFTLTAMFDPSLSFINVVTYNIWIVGPLLIAMSLFFVGRGLYSLHLRGRSPRTVWLVAWAVSSIALFGAIWTGVIEITSIGASETPLHIFLRFTALIAAVLTLLAQAFIIPWLVNVSRMLPGLNTIDATGLDNNALEME